MSYETGTLATPKLLFDRIVAQVQSTAFMGAGNEWDLVYSYDGWAGAGVDTSSNRIIASFLVPGPSGAGDYHLALMLEPSAGTNTTNILFAAFEDDPVPPHGTATWTWAGVWSSAAVAYSRGHVVRQGSTNYICDVAHTSAAGTQPGTGGAVGIWIAIASTWMGTLLSTTNSHTLGYAKMWNGGTGDIPYWLIANASRLMLVTRSDSRYHFAHTGGIIRIGSAAGYALPTLLAANNPASGDTYLDTGGEHRNFPCAGSGTANNTVSLKLPGNGTASGAQVHAFPPGSNTPALLGLGRQPNGDHPLMPVLVGASAGGVASIAGTVDGLFLTDNRGSVSENIITAAGQDYLVIEDVFRGEASHFLAIRLA